MWILRKKGSITAKKLGKLLNCHVKRYTLPRHRHFIINYGTDYRLADLNKNVILDKLLQLKILEQNGILIPKIFYKNDLINDEDFPLLARKHYHSRGRDIIYIQNREELNRIPKSRYDYLVKYIPKVSEYRVHILGDYRVIVNVKFKDEENADPIVRCLDNGWRQINYERKYYDELVELARKVIKILNYDFGAVDIIRYKRKLYVLEVNSAPGLEKKKRLIYSDYFRDVERRWKEVIIERR